MQLTDFPRPVPAAAYERVLAAMAARIMAEPGAVAVYQVGGVAAPGISDLDVCAVFEDGARVAADPRADLDAEGRYIVTHGQFGLCRAHLAAAAPFGFFHGYRHVAGTVLEIPSPPPAGAPGTDPVKVQEGLEYLVKMWVWLTVARTYGIIRLRSLLLLVKGLLYDLEYVGVTQGTLVDLIRQAVGWRQAWFQSRPGDREIRTWVGDFAAALEQELGRLLESRPLFVPDWAEGRIARNMELVPGAGLRRSHRGLPLPAFLAGLGRRYFNLQHRLNSFRFELPMASAGMPAAVAARHELLATLVAYNRRQLPHYMPVTFGLALYPGRFARS